MRCNYKWWYLEKHFLFHATVCHLLVIDTGVGRWEKNKVQSTTIDKVRHGDGGWGSGGGMKI